MRGASFQTIVGTAKEAELLLREEFGDLKKLQASSHFIGTLSGGRGFYRGDGTSHNRGPIHASFPVLEGGQGPCGSHNYR